VIARLVAELRRQDEKWGEQNHPLIGGKPTTSWCTPQQAYGMTERHWKRINDQRVEDDAMGWDSILLEEVYEALAATEKAEQITELIQVAAVAIQAAMALDRRED
jgi:ketopantoate hydroxymethyltransferase